MELFVDKDFELKPSETAINIFIREISRTGVANLQFSKPMQKIQDLDLFRELLIFEIEIESDQLTDV